MRVGLVCPYAWEVPGGVQFHVRDLAEKLIGWGHEVSVLAPADDDVALPSYVVPGGRVIPVPYNGSVARLAFGVGPAGRTRRWLRDGGFDVLHVHEPATPSLSLLACWAATGPVVATFHTSNPRSRAMTAASGVLQSALEKIDARIAVSEAARTTLVEHVGGDAVLIPNGVDVGFFTAATPRSEWQGGTLGFVGRLDEPRKGLPTLLDALPAILDRAPATRLLIAGRGDADDALDEVPDHVRGQVIFLGQVSDAEKASLLRSVDAYVAPNLGGESFGIVLVEAMAAGAPVLASDLDPFRAVLDGGKAGRLFRTGDAGSLAAEASDLLADGGARARLRAAGLAVVGRYDWDRVAADILAVYETISEGAGPVGEDVRGLGLGRLRR